MRGRSNESAPCRIVSEWSRRRDRSSHVKKAVQDALLTGDNVQTDETSGGDGVGCENWSEHSVRAYE